MIYFFAFLFLGGEKVLPLPKSYGNFLKELDPGFPQKSEVVNSDNYDKAYSYAFAYPSFESLRKSSCAYKPEFYRLHVKGKKKNIIVTIIINKKSTLVEWRSLNIDPDSLTSKAIWGREWRDSFNRGELTIIECKTTTKRSFMKKIISLDIFSFPSSQDIERKGITLHGAVFRLECYRLNRYHEIAFEAPRKGDSEYDNEFLSLLNEFEKLLKRCNISSTLN